jgi:hypothetical protein
MAIESRDETLVQIMARQCYIRSLSYGLLANALLSGNLNRHIGLQGVKKANRS